MALTPASGLAVLFVAIHLVWADARGEPPIDTDGPDFVESTEAVGKSQFQFETGPSLQRNSRHGASETARTTPLVLKYGLSRNVEVRFETDGRTLSTTDRSGTPAAVQRGMADVAIGLKWHVQDRNAAPGDPAVAWILPTGTGDVRGHGIRLSLRSVIGWDLSSGYTLGVMPVIRYDTRKDGHRYSSAILGTVLGKTWSSRFRTFIEVSAPQIAAAKNGGVILFKDVGAAWLITNTWQIGGRIAWAANANTPGMYALLSLAAKF